MKKIISCLITISVFLSLIPASFAEGYNQNAESFAAGMGLIDEYTGSKEITRAEFAVTLARLMGLVDENAAEKEWQESNYGEKNEETVILEEMDRTFYDVDVSHPYYREIAAVANRGYMRGVSETLFAPEYNLLMKDAVSVFINMMGYAQMYTNNKNIPSSIGLLDGIDSALDRPATQGDVVSLIFNALDINIIEIELNGDRPAYVESEETFMTAVLELGKIKGIMTDNGRTTFTGESNIGKKQIKIGDVVADLSDATEYARDFIGHNVEMYYRVEDDVNVAAFLQISAKDNSFRFDINAFEGFANNTISYTNGNRSINRKIDSDVDLIYNGEAITVFNEATFDFQSGDVTVISTNGSTYDLIIVNSYEFAVVKTRNTNDGTILNKINVSANTDPKAAELNIINCTAGEDYESVSIKDTNGEAMTFENLTENDVLNILRNSKELNITVNRTKAEGFKIASISNDEWGRESITDDNAEYTLNDAYADSNAKVDFLLSASYTIYLTMFNTVVWAEKAGENESIGILTKVFYNENASEPIRMVKLYTTDGKMVQLNATEKIKLNGKGVKFENAISDLSNFYGKPVMYVMNEEDKLEKIITPEGFGEFGERGWHEIAPEGSYQYHANDNDLDRMMYYVSGKTTVFTVPTNPADYNNEKNFSVNVRRFSDNETVTASGYAKDKFSVVPDVIILKTEAVVGATAGQDNVLLIEEVYGGLNEYDEPVTILSGYHIKDKAVSRTEFIVSTDCVMVKRTGGEVDKTKPDTEVGPRTPSELKPGDAIRYKTGSTGELISIRIAYDMSTGKAFATGAGEDTNAGGTTVAGYAYVRSGDSVRVTKTTDISPANVNLKDAQSVKDSLYAYRVNCPNAILVVEKGRNDKVRIYQGSLDDLATYYDTSSKQATDILVLHTHWTSAMRGAVIYK